MAPSTIATIMKAHARIDIAQYTWLSQHMIIPKDNLKFSQSQFCSQPLLQIKYILQFDMEKANLGTNLQNKEVSRVSCFACLEIF